MIFDKIWINKETLQYPTWALQRYAKAVKIPEGVRINSIDQFLDLIRGKSLKVTVKNVTSEYNGQTYENLNVTKMEQSELPAFAGEIKPSVDQQIDELDLPF